MRLATKNYSRISGYVEPGFGALFYKEWVKLLVQKLPNALLEDKGFSWFRHAVNTELAGLIQDTVRRRLLGHAEKDVNGRVYLKELPDKISFSAVKKIKVVTAHIQARKVSLDH